MYFLGYFVGKLDYEIMYDFKIIEKKIKFRFFKTKLKKTP